MLRKRLNLKEKLGSIVKRGESHGTDNDCYDITDVESAEELKLKCEANAKENEASPWSYEERKAFEEQLEQLGDQLGDSLIKNAELGESDIWSPDRCGCESNIRRTLNLFLCFRRRVEVTAESRPCEAI